MEANTKRNEVIEEGENGKKYKQVCAVNLIF